MANPSHDSHAHDAGQHGGHHDVVVDHSHHVHASSFQLFLRVYVALCFLTIVTVAASRVDFGPMNMVIAVLIASIKRITAASVGAAMVPPLMLTEAPSRSMSIPSNP